MTHTLYYNPANDTLIVGTFHNNNKNLVPLFHSYEEKGYNHNKPTVEVGNSEFNFTIETNFGYSNNSYLRFKAVYKGSQLFSFPSINDPKGKDGPSKYFCVVPDVCNWFELLNLLCYVYNNRENWNINRCLEWLDQRLQNDVLDNVIIMACSLRGYFEILDAVKLGTCTPIQKLTEQLCSRELPTLAKYLLDNNCATNNVVYTTIELIFEYLTSIGRLDVFLSAINENI